jgi:hypothetical protein
MRALVFVKTIRNLNPTPGRHPEEAIITSRLTDPAAGRRRHDRFTRCACEGYQARPRSPFNLEMALLFPNRHPEKYKLGKSHFSVTFSFFPDHPANPSMELKRCPEPVFPATCL